jgi:type IV pilus assembly protein PilN
MIRINLLPYRAARKKENIRIQVNVFLGSLILLALVIYLINSYLSGQIKDLRAEISNNQAQVAKYQKINKEIDEIKKKLAVLNQKIEVITSLEKDRMAPVYNLDALYNLLVEKRMWYTQIEEKGTSIKINGIAIDNQTVADFMTRVEKSERFENVKLAATKQQKIKSTDLNLKQFGITFNKEASPKEPMEVKK